MAKHYFAVKTREAEVTEKLLEKPSVRELPVYSAIEYLKERGFFFCAKLEKNPKCPELWMATTHLLMIDWNKSNDGEYFVSNPQNLPKIQSH